VNTAITEPRVSAIVPVLGDLTELERLLGQLRAARPGPAEIIVVDGGASADCRRLCETAGAVYLAARPGRGHQQRRGAEEASGEALWFLHADASIPPGAVATIGAALRDGAVGGCFRFRFGGPPGRHKTALAALINLRARIGVPYGDQGLFATRSAYLRAGGFADVPLFEEVALVKGLRRAGRFALLRDEIAVSPRRWERDGWLRRTLENRLLALAFMAGIAPQRLARWYQAHHGTRAPRADEPQP
jgi:rSAM/selenodomain-associated transferase 2